MKEKLKTIPDIEILENIDIKNYTTFKISCIVKYFVKPKNESALLALLKVVKKENIRYKVMGKGSNLVFVKDWFNGVIISLEYFNDLKIEKDRVIVGAGYSIMKLALETANKGLSGLEFASGIPGSVGGSLINNAGAYGSDMSSIVKVAKIITPNNEIKTFTKEEIGFSYRSTHLQYKSDFICLEVELKLVNKNKEEILETIRRRHEKRLSTQPLEYPSAGSVFRNPNGKSAGELIELLGFKGKRIGGAEVSRKHANFIINTGNATGSDVKKLILEIKEAVNKEYSIDLVYEQEFVE